MLAHGRSVTNSLYGLENSIPPKPSVRITASLSDVNKPLPLTPAYEEPQTRSSSLYSVDIDDLIDLYLGGGFSSKASSKNASLTLPESYHSMPQDTSKFYSTGKFSVSESMLCKTIYTDQAFEPDRSETDEVTIRYRYSNPEGYSPTISELISRDYLQVDDIRTTNAAKKYRDTLLPPPFTPISVKSPDLFPDIVPLRGPRFIATSSSEPILQKDATDQPTIANFNETSDRGSLGRTIHDSNEPSDRISNLRTHNEYPWDQHSVVYSEACGLDRSLVPYRNHTTLTHSNAQALSSFHSIPMSYLTTQQTNYTLFPTRSSSISSHHSQSNASSFPLPRNWSPHLKPSNPAIPRIPLSERSPAIGLSAYQMLGPKAWEADKRKGREQGRNLFGGKAKISRQLTGGFKSLDLGSSSTLQMQNRPHSSRPYQDIQTNLSDVFWSPSHNIRSYSSSLPDGQNLHTKLVNASTEGNIGLPANSTQFSHLTLRRNTGHNDKISTRNTSWFKTQKQRLMGDKHDAWGKGLKDKIIVIPTHNDTGPLQGTSSSRVASEAQFSNPDITYRLAPKLSGPLDLTPIAVMPDNNWI